MFINYVKIARPDHWIKNLFIVPGAVSAVLLLRMQFDWNIAIKVFIAFVATSLAASANYVINEWLDAEFDKFHPVKSKRPAVSHGLKKGVVYTEYAILLILSIVVSMLINGLQDWKGAIPFTSMTVWLLVMGVFYNVRPFRTKDVPYLDVLSESVNNMIRLLLGWFAVTSVAIPPCSLMVGYWLGGAFLMAIKRFSEYRMINDPERASLYRKSFARYSESSLLVSGFLYAVLSFFLVGVFLIKYHIELLMAMPFMAGMYGEYLFIAYKPDSAAQRPEKLYSEYRLMIWTALFVVSLVASVLFDVPLLEKLFTTVNFK